MDGVDHSDPALRRLLLLIYFNFSVKVALALKVVAKVSAPFIEQVIVNGTTILRDGKPTGELPGWVLHRPI